MKKIIPFLLVMVLFVSFSSAGSIQRVCTGNPCVIKFSDFITEGMDLERARLDVYTIGDIGVGSDGTSFSERVNIFVDGDYVGTSDAARDTCSYFEYTSQRVFAEVTSYAEDNSLEIRCAGTNEVSSPQDACGALGCYAIFIWDEAEQEEIVCSSDLYAETKPYINRYPTLPKGECDSSECLICVEEEKENYWCVNGEWVTHDDFWGLGDDDLNSWDMGLGTHGGDDVCKINQHNYCDIETSCKIGFGEADAVCVPSGNGEDISGKWIYVTDLGNRDDIFNSSDLFAEFDCDDGIDNDCDDSADLFDVDCLNVPGIWVYPPVAPHAEDVTFYCKFFDEIVGGEAYFWLATLGSVDWNRLENIEMSYDSDLDAYYYKWTVEDFAGQEYKAHCELRGDSNYLGLHEVPLDFIVGNTDPVVSVVNYDENFAYCEGGDIDQEEGSLLAKFSLWNETNLLIHDQIMYWDPDDFIHYYPLSVEEGNYSINCTLYDSDDGKSFKARLYVDEDGDLYVDVNYGGDDCNDSEALVNPGVDEICDNLIDDDCDGDVDMDDSDCYPVMGGDDDGDGFIDIDDGGNDCDDTNASINPDADEVCGDGVDNDCDGQIDEGCDTSGPGGGPGGGTPSIYYDSDDVLNGQVCLGESVTYSIYDSRNNPIMNATFTAYLGSNIVKTLYSNSDGEIITSFSTAGLYNIRITKTNYRTVNFDINVADCRECTSDSDCGDNYRCVNWNCVLVTCVCGEVMNHRCVAYECCDDNDCDYGESCVDHVCVSDIPTSNCGDGVCDIDENSEICFDDCGCVLPNCQLIPSILLLIIGVLFLALGIVLKGRAENNEDEINKKLKGVLSPVERESLLDEKSSLIKMKKSFGNLIIFGIILLILALLFGIYYMVIENPVINCWLLTMILLIVFMAISFIKSLIYKPPRKKILEAEIISKQEGRDLTPLIIYIKKSLSKGYTEDKIRGLLKSTPYTQEEINKAFIIAKPMKSTDRISVVKKLGPKVSEEAKRLEEVTKKLEEQAKKLRKLKIKK